MAYVAATSAINPIFRSFFNCSLCQIELNSEAIYKLFPRVRQLFCVKEACYAPPICVNHFFAPDLFGDPY